MVNRARLHYIYDPLCGWCYGASPLIKVARELADVQAHGGGMMAGSQRRAVTPALRQLVVGHDRRIAQASGQVFGDAYVDGLLRDEGAVLDSVPPITAVMAAEQVAQRGLDLLARLQTAHYVEGRRVADAAVVQTLAEEIGLDAAGFRSAFDSLQGAATEAHIDSSRALLSRVGGHGFPTLALERGDALVVLDIAAYLGRPDAWRTWLGQQVTGGAA